MKKITLLFTFLMCAAFGFAQTVAIPGVTIPDNVPAGVTSMGTATTLNNSITAVTVDLDITHTWNGDLYVELTSPEGTTVAIYDRPGEPAVTNGCNDDGLNITLVDGGAGDVEVCTGGTLATGDYNPSNPLSSFNGEDPNGNWVMLISDNAGGDTGDLNSATINITGETLGVDENEIGGFNMFPNPVSSNLTIEAPKAIEAISIVNMLGQEVIRTTPNSLMSTIDMSDLKSGFYFVKATVDGVTATRRIVRE